MRRMIAVMALTLGAAGGAAEADQPAPAPAPPPGPVATAAEIPKKIAAGTNGVFQPGVNLQAWFVYDQTDGDATTPSAITNSFRIRRAEMNAKGEILPGMVAYGVVLDLARVREPVNTTIPVTGAAAGETVTVKQFPAPGSIFQDVYVTYLTPWAEVSIGQFKVPVSWEGYNSSAKLLFPERALVSSAYGDKRDIGLKVTKSFKGWSYFAGVYNGATSNNLDTNNSKDVSLRLEAYPIDGLMLGAVGYASVGERLAPTTRDRWEFDARYERGPFLFQSEYIHARDGGGAGWVEAQGAYVAAGYMVTDKLQPVVRVGFLDPDVHKDLDPVADKADEAWDVNVGVNYYLQKHEAKLQVAFQRVQYDVKAPLNELIVAAQVSF
jgi:hypothetical protein